MKKSKEELLQDISTIAGENPTDQMISLLEDVADSFDETVATEVETVDNSEEIATIQAEADARCLAIEAEWRARYIARFNGSDESQSSETQEAPVSVDKSMFE